MQRSDWFAVLVAVFMLGAGAVLNTFSSERLAGMALMAAAVVGLIIWFAWGHLTPATWTADGKVSRGRIRAVGGVVVLCVLISASYVASHWPTDFLRSPSPSTQTTSAPTEPTGPIMSRLDHFILGCDRPPPPPNKTVEQTLAELREYKSNLDIWGDAFGVTFTMVTIRGGVRIDGEAVTDEAKQRLFPYSARGMTKFTLEMTLPL
jgi:hypothetical protein